jgi:hypothetical protein
VDRRDGELGGMPEAEGTGRMQCNQWSEKGSGMLTRRIVE